jgi:hypothetical protein
VVALRSNIDVAVGLVENGFDLYGSAMGDLLLSVGGIRRLFIKQECTVGRP